MSASVRCLLICPSILLACGRSEEAGRAANGPAATPHAIAQPGQEPASYESDTTQEPGSLRPIMRQLAVNMSGLTNALWLENYDEMILRSRAIADHPDISAVELERIHNILGRETTTFDAIDDQVHVASHRMYAAAQARQLGVFLEQLGKVQRGCTSCHTQFRNRLRNQP